MDSDKPRRGRPPGPPKPPPKAPHRPVTTGTRPKLEFRVSPELHAAVKARGYEWAAKVLEEALNNA